MAFLFNRRQTICRDYLFVQREEQLAQYALESLQAGKRLWIVCNGKGPVVRLHRWLAEQLSVDILEQVGASRPRRGVGRDGGFRTDRFGGDGAEAAVQRGAARGGGGGGG